MSKKTTSKKTTKKSASSDKKKTTKKAASKSSAKKGRKKKDDSAKSRSFSKKKKNGGGSSQNKDEANKQQIIAGLKRVASQTGGGEIRRSEMDEGQMERPKTNKQDSKKPTSSKKDSRSKSKKQESKKQTPRQNQTPQQAAEKHNDNSSKKTARGALLGRVKRNPDGFGFFICEDVAVEDVYIPKEEMYGVFSNDKVEVKVNRRAGKFGTRGEVLRVVERDSDRFIGRLNYNSNFDQFFLKDSAHNWGQDMVVTNDIGAKDGELVVVEVEDYPDPRNKPNSMKRNDLWGTFTGKVHSSIGSEVDPNTDNLRILHEHSVPIEFSEKALKEARKYGDSVREEDKKGRVDLRQKCLITIDGVTAKDFDDAILVENTKSGGYKLTVAIADVSHYVQKGTTLDGEAYNKGTSVYLANYVCPMLPEELSNGLCSLNPKVDRLCFCCEITFDSNAETQSYKFFEGVMNSHARVTYGEAQDVLEDAKGGEHPKHVNDVIKLAAELSEKLNVKRMKEGSVDFNVPSVKVLVNDSGEPTDLVNEERIFAHRLIEELMLATNICSSKFLESKKIAQLFRVHEAPEQEDLTKLGSMLKTFLKTNVGKIKSSFDFQSLSKQLEQVEDKNVSAIAQGFILRSMKQAQYSSKNQGHFGLNFTHYAHFTSPIRRYPDLVIHRQIKSILNQKDTAYPEEDVSSMGVILSAAEQRAVKAERKVISVKKSRFFEKYVGEDFDGYISSVVKFGAFVTLREFPIDGLIKLDELTGDFFVYDEENWCLRGRKTGKTFRVGDKVKIKVVNVSVTDGKIDFSLVEHGESKNSSDQSDKSVSKREQFFEKFISEGDPEPRGRGKKKKSSYKPSRDKENKKNNEEERSKDDSSQKKKMKHETGVASMFSSSSKSRGLAFGKKKPKKKK
jgi:ribonuclease R